MSAFRCIMANVCTGGGEGRGGAANVYRSMAYYPHNMISRYSPPIFSDYFAVKANKHANRMNETNKRALFSRRMYRAYE